MVGIVASKPTLLALYRNKIGYRTERVTVFWPDGGNRVIFFEKGKAAYSDAGGDFKVEGQADLSIIKVNQEERFEIPDAVICGG